jgi:hypothetical protein
VDEQYLDRVRGYPATEPYKKALRKRQVWVEPLFAEAKDWHGMRRFRLRRLWRVNCEALMRAGGKISSDSSRNEGGDAARSQQRRCMLLFLASFGWLMPTALGYVSVSLFIGTDYFRRKSKRFTHY